MSAPAFGSIGALFSGTSSTPAIAVPASVASGDGIVIYLWCDVSTTTVTTPPSGFVAAENSPVTVNAGGSGNYVLHILTKRATGADSGTYTVTLSGSVFVYGYACRYTGIIASGGFLDSPTASADGGSTSSTSCPAVSVTTGGPDRLLAYCGGNSNGDAGTWSPPTGFTLDSSGAASVENLCLAHKTQTTQGSSGNVSGTSTSSGIVGSWLGAIIGTTAASSASVPSPLTPAAPARPSRGWSLVLSSQAPSLDAQPAPVLCWAPRPRPQPAGSALVLSSTSPSLDAQPSSTMAFAVPRPIAGSALALCSRADPPVPTDSPPRAVLASPLRPAGPGTALVVSSQSPSPDAQPPTIAVAAGIGPLRRGSAAVLGSAADPSPPMLPVSLVVPGPLAAARAGVAALSRGPVPPFVAPPGTQGASVASAAATRAGLAPQAVVTQPQRMHSCATPPARTGATTRPGPATTTRPNTGITVDPCC